MGRGPDGAMQLSLVRIGRCRCFAGSGDMLVLGKVGRANLTIRAHDNQATATAKDQSGGGRGRGVQGCFGATNRGIQRDILSDTSCVADLALEHVTVNAVGGGLDGVLAGTAGVHELAGVLVLLRVQHVRALVAELERDLLVVVLLGAEIGRAGIGR